MAGPAQPPFYVPRFEPTFWMGSPLDSAAISLLTQQKISGAGGQVKTKLWRWDHVPAPDWIWTGPPPGSVKFLLTANGKPFKTEWAARYEYVPPADWLGRPVKSSYAALLVSKQPFNKEWSAQYTYVPDALWLGMPIDASYVALRTQLNNLFQSPVYVPKPPPTQEWQWQPLYNDSLKVQVANPFSNQWFSQYKYVPPPEWTWTGSLPGDIIFQLTAGGSPFAKQWRYDYQPDAIWIGEPQPTNIETLPVAGEPFNNEWTSQYTYVPQPDWGWKPPASNTLRLLTEATPFAHDWGIQYTYVPSAVWQGTPLATNIETFPTVGEPFNNEWGIQYTYTPQPDWSWKPPPTDTLRILTQAKPFAKQWRYDLTPQPDWVWKAPPSGTLRTLTQAKPFSRQWRYDYMPEPVWQGRPLAWNTEIRPTAVVVPFAPPQWSQWDYVPDRFWSWSGRTGNTISLSFLLRRVPTDAVLGMFGYFAFGQEIGAPHLHHDITDTTIIQKPTDAILMGQQDYEFTDKTWDVRPMDVKVRVTISTDGVKNISGTEPTFTTKTGNRGYD